MSHLGDDPIVQDFIRPGMVQLALKHLPCCNCNLTTADPEATLVQLGCVTGYLVERGSAPTPCAEETPSWQHFTPEQTDSYWIRCTLSGPHDEHKDEHTGLTWGGGPS